MSHDAFSAVILHAFQMSVVTREMSVVTRDAAAAQFWRRRLV